MNKIVPIAILVLVTTGASSAFAASNTVSIANWDIFCERKTTNIKTTAADFICQVDIFQMEERLENQENRIKVLESLLLEEPEQVKPQPPSNNESQSPTNDSVYYLNSIDVNPRGDDWEKIVEYVSVCSKDIQNHHNMEGWQVIPLSNPENAYVFEDVVMPRKCISITQSEPLGYDWLDDKNEIIELRDSDGNLMYVTPPLSDDLDNHSHFQYDLEYDVWNWILLK